MNSEIKWSEVVCKSIAERIGDLEMMEKLTKKSKLTEKDIEELAHKINREVYEELDKR